MKSDVLSSLRFLRPLAQSLWGSNCILCDKPQARWEIRAGDSPAFLCGMCVVYETSWGKTNADFIESVSKHVEQHGSRKLERDTEGRLVHSKEADDIMGVVVLMDMTMRRIPSGKK